MSVRSTLLDAFYSLSAGINKAGGRTGDSENIEGVVGERLPELTLTMDSEDLIDLSNTWEKTWNESDVKQKWVSAGDENENYWKGKHYDRPEIDKSRAIVDNAIFEGLETYLPQVTRRNPEPMVTLAASEVTDESDPTRDAKNAFVKAVQAELGELADELKMRLKLKAAARHKEIYLLGAAKFGWDLDKDIPSMKIVRPRRLLLDPEATVDEDGYTGDRIGEYRKLPAWKIVALIEGEKDSEENIKAIKELVQNDMATEVAFIEWWTNEYMFWKMNDKILTKRKNPHWNYDEEAPALPENQATTEPISSTDENAPVEGEGQSVTPPAPAPAAPEDAPAPDQAPMPEADPNAPPMPELPAGPVQGPPQPKKGVNHFSSPKMPYILLATFTLGKQPVDVTSNIGQNLANQDIVNKRNKQIDKNADSMNQGLVVSMERTGLSAQQAKGVTAALRKGGTVVIPAGAPSEAVMRLPTPGLPADIYNDLQDKRTRIRDIWGIRGSSPAGIQNEDTVRGKVIVKTLDTDRIGGGIAEYLEQFSDDAYNHLTQMLYVYDDRFAAFFANGGQPPKIKVSVKEGSLLPKDASTIANQAIELSGAGKMSTLDLYKALDKPNPEELAANAWLEVNAPEILYAHDPRVAQVVQMKQQAAQAAAKPPSESINFKDLPPDGKTQMAKQAGIELAPETIVAHDAATQAAEAAAKNSQLPTAQDIAPAA